MSNVMVNKIITLTICFFHVLIFCRCGNEQRSKNKNIYSIQKELVNLHLKKIDSLLIAKEKDLNDSIYYQLAQQYSLIGNEHLAFFYLNLHLKSDSSASSVTSPAWFNLIKTQKWEGIINEQLSKVQFKRKQKFRDSEVTKKLWTMLISDQAYFSDMEFYFKQLGYRNSITDSLWKIKAIVTRNNIKQLDSIVNQYGWPKKSEFGETASSSAFLIVQHSDSSYLEKYLPLVEANCKINEANWADYAYMKDRLLMDQQKSQLYGTQLISNGRLGGLYLYQLSDPENVDKRRFSMGLPPLKIYLQRWGVFFNVQQNR